MGTEFAAISTDHADHDESDSEIYEPTLPPKSSRCASCGGGACLLMGLFLALGGSWRWISRGTTRSNDPFESLYNTTDGDSSTCRDTPIYPFRFGCPEQCQRAVNATEPMYRMSLAWFLGDPNQPEGVAYDKGYNYQCPIPLVENFRRATDTLEATIPTSSNGLLIGRQSHMHISLSYLCCLRRNETDWVREIMYQWVQENYPFRIPVNFVRLECWHIRPNSVTVIVVADTATQQRLLQLNLDLQHKIWEKGIPTEVLRVQQMAFHMTLLEVYRNADNHTGHGDEASMHNPRNDIRPNLAEIYQHVSNYSSTMTQWTGGQQMILQHAPYFTFDAELQAGIEPNV